MLVRSARFWYVPVAVLLSIVGLVWYVRATSFTGTIVVESQPTTANGSYLWSKSLSGVHTTTLGRGPFSTRVSFAPDGKAAELRKLGNGWQVVLSTKDGERVLTQSKTLKRDLVWAQNGLSLAYAEADPTRGSLGSPTTWTVQRVLTNGDTIEAGKGIRPIPVAGSETLMLTEDGVVRARIGDIPELIIKSPKKVFDTPLAATADGTYIAWVNPGDAQLQVFTLTAARSYIPYAHAPVRATSLAFNAEGTELLATVPRDADAVLFRMRLSDGTVSEVGTLEEKGIITDWYE